MIDKSDNHLQQARYDCHIKEIERAWNINGAIKLLTNNMERGILPGTIGRWNLSAAPIIQKGETPRVVHSYQVKFQ